MTVQDERFNPTIGENECKITEIECRRCSVNSCVEVWGNEDQVFQFVRAPAGTIDNVVGFSRRYAVK